MKKIILGWQATTKARWQRLAPREQYTLLGGCCLLLLWVLYVGLWSPFLMQIEILRTQLPQEQVKLREMQETDRKIKLLGKKPARYSRPLAQELKTLADKIKAAPLGSQLSQLAPLGSDELRCGFQKVDFDALMAWLIDFSREEKLMIEEAKIERVNSKGVVNAEFVLRMG